MKLEAAKEIVDCSDGNCELYENYSGRGMYGKSTTAVTFDNLGEFICSAVIAGKYIAMAGEDGNPELEHEEFCEELRTLRFDQLGKGQIAY